MSESGGLDFQLKPNIYFKIQDVIITKNDLLFSSKQVFLPEV
jgi:hypothetical protein